VIPCWILLRLENKAYAIFRSRPYGETARALKTEEVKTRLATIGTEPVGMPPEEFQPFVRAELQKWAKLAREVGIKPE
jgi:tripartite-type tricarboxylate transporter receptor subunit TctC